MIVHEPTGKILARNVEVAGGFWSRLRGLMFRRNFEQDSGILFSLKKPKKFSVHTFFVFFPIDLIYLDSDLVVVDLKENMGPWSTYSPNTKASYLLELVSGKIDDVGVKVGDEVVRRDEG